MSNSPGSQHSATESKTTLYQNDKGADTDVSLDQQYLEDAEKRGIAYAVSWRAKADVVSKVSLKANRIQEGA